MLFCNFNDHICPFKYLITKYLGRDGGQVDSVLAFYSDDPSSDPADADFPPLKICV